MLRHELRTSVRESLGISPDTLVITFEGEPVEENGFSTLLNIMEQVSIDDYLSTRVRFLIVTDTNQIPERVTIIPNVLMDLALFMLWNTRIQKPS